MRYLALEAGVGRLEEDGTVSLLDAGFSLADHLAAGRRLEELEDLPVVARAELDTVKLGPLTRPDATVWGIGLNYRSKQEATGRELPNFPTFFLKAPSATARPGEPIRIPSSAPSCVDYEGEIAVVVVAPLFQASPVEAARAVGAVAAADDVTARDVMRFTRNPSLAKSYPSFGQLGSAVIDPAAAGGVGAVTLTTTVNGQVRQADTGGGMLLGVPELLAMLSAHAVLRPGDVLLTGTPAGTGEETRSYLAPGDVVEVAVADLPALRSEVVGAQALALEAG